MLTKVVNFFGHAAVAAWMIDGDPRLDAVVLGAMLPDFATMVRGRFGELCDEAVARGVALHHATDSVFHQLPAVVAQMRELDARLARGSCARGPRRAVAHVGLELLLDGVLVADPASREAYVRGVACAAANELAWRDADERARFLQLVSRLCAYGPPDDLREPRNIVPRLARMLAHRPLLAPSADDLRAIERALVDHAPRVAIAADTITRALRATLAGRAATRDAAGGENRGESSHGSGR
jgi:acyl carrier protein phosphodiesterase